MNRIKRLFFKLLRFIINIIRLFNRRLYQQIFLIYLKYVGVNIIGKPTYISNDIFLDDIDYSLITIKDGTVISIKVIILVHDYAITRAFIATGESYNEEISIVKPVTIGRNCFIGAGSIILPGTSLGDNVIVGAGSIVKGNIPPNVVIAGNPAKVIGSIFEYKVKQINNNREFFKTNI